MKFKPYFTDIILVVSLACLVMSIFRISNLSNENKSLKREIKSQDSIIDELDVEIDILGDEIQERDREVRFWGMKYDSIKTN